MRRTPIYENDTTPEGVSHAGEAGRHEMPRAGTLIARAAAHDRISAALRKARKRASLSPEQVVDLMRARGVSITTATLERWEQGGGIRLEEAVDLAAVYHITIDELADRRSRQGRLFGSMERGRLHQS
jgi:DNA-binding transcriptional regulator YiaG